MLILILALFYHSYTALHYFSSNVIFLRATLLSLDLPAKSPYFSPTLQLIKAADPFQAVSESIHIILTSANQPETFRI